MKQTIKQYIEVIDENAELANALRLQIEESIHLLETQTAPSVERPLSTDVDGMKHYEMLVEEWRLAMRALKITTRENQTLLREMGWEVEEDSDELV